MDKIEETQLENITKAATIMADSIEAGRWVHTFGCGHSTLPVEEMYPRIGGFVGFHPIIELPLSFFTHIVGDMGVHQFIFLERVEGYGNQIMKGYNFDERDLLASSRYDFPPVVFGSAEESRGKKSRHSCGKNIFEIADIVVDSCVPLQDASVDLKNHQDKIGPLSTHAYVSIVWMTITTVAEMLADRNVKLFIHPSHNVPGDTTAHERLDAALAEYKRRVAGV